MLRSQMGALALSTLVTLFALPAMGQEDYLGAPGPIDFGGVDYALAWSSNPSEGYFKHEYVPQGQQVETFDDMFIIEAVYGAVTPENAVAAMIAQLDQRKGSDPVVNYEVLRNGETGEVLLDFLLSDTGADPIVVEWNAYRYTPLEDGEGVALYAISRRGYGEDGARALLQGLGEARGRDIEALAGMELPAVEAR